MWATMRVSAGGGTGKPEAEAPIVSTDQGEARGPNAGSSQLAFTTNIAGHNGTVQGGSGFSIPFDTSSPRIDIQVFDPANPTTAWTITISQAPDPNGGTTFVGQMLIGLL
jgi:hypothetical protein